MMRLSIYFFCLFLSASGLVQTASAQQEFKTTKSSIIGYLEYLPNGYHSNNNKYPVVIFLHGKGEKGPNSRNPSVLSQGVTKLTKLGPPHFVKKGTKFPFILISPQLKSGCGDWPEWYIKEVIDHVKKTLRIDERRIYLTGLSLGGGGVWKAAEENPGLFAAIAPVCGSSNNTRKAEGLAKNKVPVWAFHGDKDNIVPLKRTVNMVNAINSHRADPRAKVTIYRSVKHEAWDKAYKPDHSEHKPNVYDWMLSHVKGSSSSSSGDKQEIANKPPVVNAGNDRTITEKETKLELKASASDSDGSIKKYEWKKVSGGDIKMDGQASNRLILSRFKKGDYTFRLTVTDNKGTSRFDDVRVKVNAAPSSVGLLAFAGPDRTVKLPVSSYTLHGGAKSPDGYIVSYEWKLLEGGHIKMTNANSRVMQITNVSGPGKRTFELVVKDTKGRIGRDHIRIYFEDSATKSSSMDANPVEIVDPSNDLDAELLLEREPSNPDNWRNLTVTIFNDQGQRIFTGKWTENSYQDIFTNKGLYVYQVSSSKNRVKSGKLFIQ